jgi:hypothetical protein
LRMSVRCACSWRYQLDELAGVRSVVRFDSQS